MRKLNCLFACLFLLTAACKKKNDEQLAPSPSPQKGSLFFHLHTNIDTSEVEYGDTAMTADGRKVTLSLAQLYLSGIKLIKTDGGAVPLDNVYVLKTADKEQYLLGDALAGDYVSVSFNVGIDAATNHTD